MDKDPHKFMSMLMDNYTVNPSRIVEPEIYLGADIRKVDLINTISSDSYAN